MKNNSPNLGNFKDDNSGFTLMENQHSKDLEWKQQHASLGNFKDDNSGFTLMEMLMVMFIIAMILLLVIPNITKNQQTAEEGACVAYVQTVQTQVTAFDLANKRKPNSLAELKTAGYIVSTECTDKTPLNLDKDGNVTAKPKK